MAALLLLARSVRADASVIGSGGLSWIPANPEGFDQEIGMFAGFGLGFGEEVVQPLIERPALLAWMGGALAAFTAIAVAVALPVVRATVASGLRAE